LPAFTKHNIESVAAIEQALLNQRSIVDRISDRITAFVGSITFVVLHLMWFVVWVAINYAVEASGHVAFDPYPFIFLNLALSIEAVLLSTFVLITQNRQSRQADHWAHLDLQINLLAEREATRMLRMLNSICEHLGLELQTTDKELKDLTEPTQVKALAEHLEQTREQNNGLSAPQ
jgi:uncharacterized membrane protein